MKSFLTTITSIVLVLFFYFIGIVLVYYGFVEEVKIVFAIAVVVLLGIPSLLLSNKIMKIITGKGENQ